MHSIESWSTQQWKNLFLAQLGVANAPVQLHPRLGSDTTSYYSRRTSGHFDVGRGYNFDNGGSKILIYEPAGGPANGNVYPRVYAEDTVSNVRKANLANGSQKNIAY
ncbi:hypothetical protein [Actinoplanes ianthinogenes]|uniref:hypothetical protein n=1 Tax=Actinoplanes ianthinogenes TaxID=122358 RepID=UPI00166FC6A4|nr:hypothetical protein [Actinoplanes ianthinogenes]